MHTGYKSILRSCPECASSTLFLVSHGMNSVLNDQDETFSSDPIVREEENTTYDFVEASLIVVLDRVGFFT